MEHSSSGKADRCSAGQEITHLSQKPKVNYHIHKSLTMQSILSRINKVHIQHLGLSSILFPLGFPSQILCFSSPLCKLYVQFISTSLIWSL